MASNSTDVHTRYLAEVEKLKHEYHQIVPDEKPVSIVSTLMSMVGDFQEVLKKAAFFEAKAKLAEKYQKEFLQSTFDANKADGGSESKKKSALVRANHQNTYELKSRIAARNGEMISPPQMGRVEPVKEIENWLARMNLFNLENRDLTQIVNTLTAKHTADVAPGSTTTLQGKTKKIEQTDDSLEKETLAQLQNISPQSLLVMLSNAQGTKRPLGIFQDEHALWFHDANHFSVCFPLNGKNTPEQIKEQFGQFLREYQAKFYQGCTQATFQHVIANVKTPTKNVSHAQTARQEILTQYPQQEKENMSAKKAPIAPMQNQENPHPTTPKKPPKNLQ